MKREKGRGQSWAGGARFPGLVEGGGEEPGLRVHPEDVGSLRAAFVSCLWGAGGSPLAAL